MDALTARLHQLIDTNRTAPGIVRIMAYANAARIADGEAQDPRAGWSTRRALRRDRARFRAELRGQLAATLDALAAEPY